MVCYDFVIKELLKKAKKTELVKFTREVLEQKISTAEKKEVFLNAVTLKVKDKTIEVSKWTEYFGWDVHDIASDLCDEDVFYAIGMISKKLNLLYYDRAQTTDAKARKKLREDIGRLFGVRNRAFVKLINQGKIEIVGYRKGFTKCARAVPVYVDTITGENLKVEDYMLFPNGKYCAAPKKGEALDLNNIEFLGSYKEENFKTVANEFYVVSCEGYEFSLPHDFKPFITVEVDESKLPLKFYESTTLDAPPDSFDNIEYRKSIRILNNFVKEETKQLRQKRLAGRKQHEREMARHKEKVLQKAKKKKANQNPNQKPKKKFNQKAKQNPNQKAKQNPNQKPKQNPNQNPNQKPKQNPNQNPNQKPNQNPNQKPNQNPSQKPKQNSNQKPKQKPKQKPNNQE